MNNIQRINKKIINWQNKVEMSAKGDKYEQYLKIHEEITELANAVINNDINNIKEEIGDVYISLMSLNMASNCYHRTKDSFFFSSYKSNEKLDKLNILATADRCLFFKELALIKNNLAGTITHEINKEVIGYLISLAKQYKLDFADCLNSAINKVTARSYFWEGRRLVRTQ